MTINNQEGFDSLKEIGGYTDDMMNRIKYRGVFHSIDSVLVLLKNKEYGCLEEVRELLDIYNKSLTKSQTGDQKKELFIVMEGLDGSGKSTLTKMLANSLGGVYMATPPPAITHLRQKFDQHNPDLRRAFYALGNYIAANDVKCERSRRPVVMDRFWNSTTAYAIGNEVKLGKELPPENSNIYDWPSDLLMPDYVIYLKVSENIRLERLSKRKDFTPEEDELKANEMFRNNLEKIYAFMKNNIHFVDGNSFKKNVLEDIKKNFLKV
uniref:Thymidylate kinase-like domain-containing protein n=1 Tax=Clastoptera arizonana TaxID=38151 RepID=A0A1B6EBD4_9HEMI